MLVVLDTNVLLSAFLWPGKTSKIILLIKKGTITPCFSKETLNELIKVLKRHKFETRLENVNLTPSSIIKVLKKHGEVFKLPRLKTRVFIEDPSDDKFLLLAKVANAKYLVSGDKHLLKLGKFGTTKIVSVSQFLKLFTQNS